MASNHQPLLPLYNHETAEEEAARKRACKKAERRRRRREMEAAQPAPEDDLFTLLSKWFARNPDVIGRFGLLSALVLAFKGIQRSILFTESYQVQVTSAEPDYVYQYPIRHHVDHADEQQQEMDVSTRRLADDGAQYRQPHEAEPHLSRTRSGASTEPPPPNPPATSADDKETHGHPRQPHEDESPLSRTRSDASKEPSSPIPPATNGQDVPPQQPQPPKHLSSPTSNAPISRSNSVASTNPTKLQTAPEQDTTAVTAPQRNDPPVDWFLMEDDAGHTSWIPHERNWGDLDYLHAEDVKKIVNDENHPDQRYPNALNANSNHSVVKEGDRIVLRYIHSQPLRNGHLLTRVVTPYKIFKGGRWVNYVRAQHG